MIGFGQNVNIPDANFKAYLVGNTAINTNGDAEIQVSEAIVFNGTIDCNNLNISDLTGIENFTVLTELDCNNNNLTSLDVSQNTSLTFLRCDWNQLTSLDVSQNTDLIYLYCGWNQLTSLDVSQSTDLTDLNCNDNQLTILDIRNGNNTNMGSIQASNNLNLTCISVDDFQFSLLNWTNPFWFGFDPQHYFSNNCSATAIEEHTTNKELLKITDLLGRETEEKNHLIFYIYDDGTVEKKIILE